MRLNLLVRLSFVRMCVVVAFLTFVSGSELEEARKKFQEEISGVRNLRLAITSALERLRLESDTLQREEAALRTHEQLIAASYERLKEKESNYNQKGKNCFSHFLFSIYTDVFSFFLSSSIVQAVVDESKRAVIAADNRRESAAVS
jgi:hypothetical protein